MRQELSPQQEKLLSIQMLDLEEIRGVSDYLLEVHERAPGKKGTEIYHFIYENLGGLSSLLRRNDNMDRVHQVIDD